MLPNIWLQNSWPDNIYILVVESAFYNITYKLKKNRLSVLLVQETFKGADIFLLLDFLHFHFK